MYSLNDNRINVLKLSNNVLKIAEIPTQFNYIIKNGPLILIDTKVNENNSLNFTISNSFYLDQTNKNIKQNTKL